MLSEADQGTPEIAGRDERDELQTLQNTVLAEMLANRNIAIGDAKLIESQQSQRAAGLPVGESRNVALVEHADDFIWLHYRKPGKTEARQVFLDENLAVKYCFDHQLANY